MQAQHLQVLSTQEQKQPKKGGKFWRLSPGNAHAEITHLVGRVDHIKLLDQLQGNKGNTKSGAGKLGITLWQHS